MRVPRRLGALGALLGPILTVMMTPLAARRPSGFPILARDAMEIAQR